MARPSLRVRVAVYAAVAVLTVLPGMLRVGGGVPGAPRSDLWNSLWSLWHPLAGGLGLETTLLDHPDGGTLLVADPLNAMLLAPLTVLLGAAAAWTVGVLAHLFFASVAADLLARELGADEGGALVAGVAFGSAPLLLASVHNGTSEAIAWGWLPLALLAIRWATRGGGWRVPLAAFAVALAGLASPYLAVATWIGGAMLVVAGPGRARGMAVLAGATLVVLPWAWLATGAATAADNLVGIKDPHELALVRRTIGAADPSVFFVPGDYRSPDFRAISRYGEDFLHVTYLGWIWMLAAAAGLWRSRRWSVGLLGLVGAILACGPVLVHDGFAVLLPGDLGIPLPYLLLEDLPGFGSLSLLYRLAVLPALAVALLAALAVRGRPAWGLAAAGLLEVLLISPVRGGPDASTIPDSAPLRAIAEGPEGAVMNHPVVAGRPYLYEATVHGRPVAATLNFPANRAARQVLVAMRDAPDDLRSARVAEAARARGIRWLVVHDDAGAEVDVHDAALREWEAATAPYATGEGIRVYRLW